MRNSSAKHVLAILALVLIAHCAPSWALTTTWTGTMGDGLWNTAGNWSAGVPGAADTAVVNSGSGNPRLTTTVTVAALTVGGTKTVTVDVGLTLTSTTTTLNDGYILGDSGAFVIPLAGTLSSDNAVGTNEIRPQITNSGAITVNTGALQISDGVSTGSLTATAAGTKIVKVSAPLIVNGGSLAGNFELSNLGFGNSTLTINIPLVMTGNISFSQNSHFINGSGSLTLTGNITALAGATATISLPTTIAAGGTLATNGTSTLTLDADITDNGSAQLPAGDISIAATRTLTCNGAVTMGVDGDFIGAGTLSLGAAAALTSDDATGTNTITATLNNAGSITVNSGALQISDGVNTGSITATAAGTKVVKVSAPMIVNGGSLAGNFELTNLGFGNSTLTINIPLVMTGNISFSQNTHFINGTGSLTLTGNITALAGSTATLSLPTTIAAGGSLATNGTSTLTLDADVTDNGSAQLPAGDISIAATRTLTCNGAVTMGVDGDFIGAGTLVLGAAAALTSDDPTGTNTITSILNNAGSITVNSGSLQISDGVNTGSITATAAGAKIVKVSTPMIVNGGSLAGNFQLDNLGFGSSTLTINIPLVMTGNISFSSSSHAINGTGSLTLTGNLTALAGSFATLSLPTTIAAGGSLATNGSSTLVLDADVTDNGSAQLPAGDISISATRTLTCNGAVTMGVDGDFVGAGTLVLGAAAALTSDDATGTNTITTFLNNAGSITVNSGSLQISDGINTGSITATAVGAKIVKVSTPLIVNGGSLAGNFQLDNLGFGSSTLTINIPLVMTGNISFSSSSHVINGTGSLTLTGNITAPAGSFATLALPTTIAAGGSLVATGGGSITINSDATVNGSVQVLSSGLSISSARTLTANGAVTLNIGDITGAGTLLIGAASTLTSINLAGTNDLTAIVGNAGTVIAQSGVLNIGTNFVQTGGMIQLAGGSVQGTVNISGGTTMGSGTITGDLNNDGGTISPGASPGRLTVTGALRQLATGRTRIEIAGRTAATEFDQISVGGTATLDGDVDVVFLNGFAPVPGDSFDILTAASRSGQYRTINSTLVTADYSNPAKVTLRATAPSAVPTVASINPSAVAAGSSAFSLVVSGTGFADVASVVQFNGTARPTTFISTTLLVADIAAADVAAAGTASISVVTAAPGGGTSGTLTLTIGSGGGGGAPVITSPLTASATVGTAFTYPITATGTAPITFGAFNLPPGLAVSGSNITGTPTQGGAASITLTATNAAGSVSAILVVTISSGAANVGPTFASLPTISANPTLVNVAVTFSAAADDGNGDLLSYTWNFGDGTTGTGASVTHAYTAAGTYVVVVTVSDGVSSATSSIPVAVNATKPQGGTGINIFAILKVGVKFSFSSANKDSLSLQGTVPLGAGFAPTGKAVVFTVGGLTRNFTLNDKGIGGDKVNAFKLAFKVKDANTPAKFAVSLKSQSLFADLQSLGYRNAEVGKPGDDVVIPVVISIDGVAFSDSITTIYTAKAGSGGSAKR